MSDICEMCGGTNTHSDSCPVAITSNALDKVSSDNFQPEIDHNPVFSGRKYGGCQHGKFRYDEKMAFVLCGVCKEKLNPIWVIARISQQESNFRASLERLSKLAEKARTKNRCKCEHCGKMTRIQR